MSERCPMYRHSFTHRFFTTFGAASMSSRKMCGTWPFQDNVTCYTIKKGRDVYGKPWERLSLFLMYSSFLGIPLACQNYGLRL